MDNYIMGLICEFGKSKDGEDLCTKEGLLRFSAIDWEKTNEIIKEHLKDKLYKQITKES